MPDIKTAFENALSKTQVSFSPPDEWDDETAEAKIESITTKETAMKNNAVYFKPTNNITRITFNYVRDNPGVARADASRALEAQGYKKTSTTSLLGQMVKQGLMRETNGGLYTAQPEYTPLKSSKVFANKLAKASSKTKTVQPKVEKKVARVASTNTLLADEFDAEKFVDGMTLKQAKAVYDVLSKVFKG